MAHFLIVFRHAKAESAGPGGSDHARSLAARGVQAARRMGQHLRDIGQLPDLVLSSSALRARTTAELAAEAGKWGAPIRVSDELYLASVASAIAAIGTLADEVGGVVLAGHEPTSSALIAELTSTSAPTFPTAAMARIDFDGPSGSELGQGRLAWLVTPSELDHAR